jgi:hypothetical protein
MSKSTPITQLPNTGGQNNFINEQQRQIVMHAQNSINAIPMPQNTQTSVDIANDDDATIQEVLNQIHSTGGMEQMENQARQPTMPPQIMTHQVLPQMMPQPVVQSQPQPMYDQFSQMQYTGQYPPQPMQVLDPLQNQTEGSMLGFVGVIAEDVKFSAFIFILFIVVHFIPIDKFLMRYFALDKIPYYDIILKALVAFVAVILFRKVFI